MDALTTNERLAPRARGLQASPIRALLDAHRGADTLDLSGGIPDPKLFPTAALTQAAQRVTSERGGFALQYAPTEGLRELRAFIAKRLEQRGYAVNVENVFVTHGSQHALCVVAQVLGAKGRKALLEQPVYPGAVQALKLSECDLSPLPVTRVGWELEAISREHPDLVYVIPHFQNPTGRCASLDQVQTLAACAKRQGFYVIEDDAYGELDFEGVVHRPLVAECPEQGILLGSFSKTLCPGLRLGYLVTPRALLPAVARTLQATTLQPGTFSQYLAWELLSNLDYEAHLLGLRRHYRAKARALASLGERLGLAHSPPRGGFFLWVEVEDEGQRVARQLAERGVLVVPEFAFRAPGLAGPDRHLRLAFTRFEDDAASTEQFTRAFA